MPPCKYLAARIGLAASLTVLPTLASAVSVETFVLAVGGQSQVGPQFQCATFGPASAGLKFFGNVSVGVPTDGLSTCGIQGGYRTSTAAKGPMADSTSVSTSFNSSPTNTVNATSAANAISGKAGASAHGTLTGPTNSTLVQGATSYGIFSETLTLNSPSIVAKTPGTVRFAFTIDGSLSLTGPSQYAGLADVEVNYQLGSGSNFILMRAQASSSGAVPFSIAGNRAPLVGFTSGPGTFGGKGTVETFDLPFDWGTATELKFGILASAAPGPDSTALVDFLNSATLTGIRAFANGQEITDFNVTTGSGAVYTANGLVPAPVPVPGAAWLLPSALAVTALTRRRTSCARVRAPLR